MADEVEVVAEVPVEGTAAAPVVEQTVEQKPTVSDEEIADMRARLEKAEADANEFRKQQTNAKRTATIEAKKGGKFEELYTNLETDHAVLQSEAEKLRAENDRLTKQNKEFEKNFSGLRTSMVNQFDEADRWMVKNSNIDELPTAFKRLYPNRAFNGAPANVTSTEKAKPSLGAAASGGATGTLQQEYEAAVAAKDVTRINAAMDKILQEQKKGK